MADEFEEFFGGFKREGTNFAVKQRKGIQFAYYNSEGMTVVDMDGVLKTLGVLDEGGALLFREARSSNENGILSIKKRPDKRHRLPFDG